MRLRAIYRIAFAFLGQTLLLAYIETRPYSQVHQLIVALVTQSRLSVIPGSGQEFSSDSCTRGDLGCGPRRGRLSRHGSVPTGAGPFSLLKPDYRPRVGC